MHLAPEIMVTPCCTFAPVCPAWHFLLWLLKSWENSSSDGRKMHNGKSIRAVSAVPLLMTFFPLDGKNLEATNTGLLLFQNQVSEPKSDMALLYPTHIVLCMKLRWLKD